MITRTHVLEFRIAPYSSLKDIKIDNNLIYANSLQEVIAYLISQNHKVIQIIPTRYTHSLYSSELTDATVITTTTE